MARFLLQWLLLTLALGLTVYLLPGLHIESGIALFVAALVLGFINAVVRPIMVLITLPITVLTLGLFYLLVNGAAFALAALLVPGFTIDSGGWAVLGAVVFGLISWLIGAATR